MKKRRSFPFKLALICGLIMLTVVMASILIYPGQKAHHMSHVEHDLIVIAEMKARRIEHWRNDKINSVRVFSQSPYFKRVVTEWLLNRRQEDADYILKRFNLAVSSYGDYDVIVVDRAKNVSLSLSGNVYQLHPEAIDALEIAYREQRTVLTELHIGVHDKMPVHIGTVSPLIDDAGEVLGAVIFQTLAEDFLNEHIRLWPVTSKTAESVLVARDEDEVVFLSDPLHVDYGELKLRLPLTRTDAPAVRAVLGEEGVFHGVDYRGEKVISFIKAIPNSPWYLVSKIDSSEALDDWLFKAYTIIFATIFFVMAVVVLLFTFWQRQSRKYYSDMYLAEKALREQEELSRITLMSVGDGVISTDVDGKIKLINSIAEQLTGWTQAEAKGKHISEVFVIISEETRNRIKDPIETVLAKGVIVGLANHTLLIAKDGTEKAIADSAAPVKAEDGSLLGVVLVFRDQTEERTVRRAIEQSEQKHRLLADNTLDAIWKMDLNFTFTYVNRASQAILGIDPEEFIGSKLTEYCQEEEMSKVINIINKALSAAEYDEGVIFNLQMRHHKGHYVPVEIHGKVMCDESGKPVGLQGTTRDVTERIKTLREIEQQKAFIQNVLDNLPIGVATNDLNSGEALYLNNRFSEIYGWPAAELKTRESFFELVYPDQEYRNQIKSKVMDDIKSGDIKRMRWEELKITTQDGTNRFITAVNIPLTEQNIMVSTVMDVTDAVQHREEVKKMNLELEERVAARTYQLESANKELEAFAYSVSHDLRAPLRAIDGFSRIIQESYASVLDEEGKRLFNVIVDNAVKMDRLISDLLELSRTSRVEIDLHAANMSRIVKSIYYETVTAEERDWYNFELHDLPDSIMDTRLMKIVWSNLIGNAVKYTRTKKERIITINGYQQDKSNVYYIKDNGVGFNPAYIGKIFGVFQRLHGVHEFEGTGVGLAIVKRIIDRHGGKVWAESKEGEGATFYFSLPKREKT